MRPSSASGISPPTNGRITSTATSQYGRPKKPAMVSSESCGQVSGTYRPPSRASPLSITSQNPRAGASPRVEIYRVKPPSKGLGARQTFDIIGLYNFADDKAARHHKAFSGEGEIGILPSWRDHGFPAAYLRCPVRRQRCRAAKATNGDDVAKVNGRTRGVLRGSPKTASTSG